MIEILFSYIEEKYMIIGNFGKGLDRQMGNNTELELLENDVTFFLLSSFCFAVWKGGKRT